MDDTTSDVEDAFDKAGDKVTDFTGDVKDTADEAWADVKGHFNDDDKKRLIRAFAKRFGWDDFKDWVGTVVHFLGLCSELPHGNTKISECFFSILTDSIYCITKSSVSILKKK